LSEWESVSNQRGNFYGWGETVGQEITGEVVSFSANGGADPDGEPCPELVLKLTEPTTSYRKGQPTEYPVGELVTMTCAQGRSKRTGQDYGLRRDVVKANLRQGDLVKMTLESLRPTSKSPQKIIDLKVKRGNGQVSQPVSQVPQQQTIESSAPF